MSQLDEINQIIPLFSISLKINFIRLNNHCFFYNNNNFNNYIFRKVSIKNKNRLYNIEMYVKIIKFNLEINIIWKVELFKNVKANNSNILKN